MSNVITGAVPPRDSGKIAAVPPRESGKLRIVMVGHVDHGKSTLIGRLLHDTGTLPDGKVADLDAMSRKRGVSFEWSFVIDALQAERDQGITIDASEIGFATATRRYAIIDAPGHAEFLRNMVTGAASADGAVAVVDVREGAVDQARRHLILLSLLGVNQVAIAINKMDAVGWDEESFRKVAGEIRSFLAELGVKPRAVVPISARSGANVATRAADLDPAAAWYDGPTLLEALDAFSAPASSVQRPLRFAVQDVYRDDERRILVGRIESGRIRVGDTLTFAPGGQLARVATIEGWNQAVPRVAAIAGESVGITLDRKLFVARGHTAFPGDLPIETARRVRVRSFWLSQTPLTVGGTYTFRVGTSAHAVRVVAIERRIAVDTLQHETAQQVIAGEIADLVLESDDPIAVDVAAEVPETGRGILLDGVDFAGGALVLERLAAPTRKATTRSKGTARQDDLRPPPERLTQARRAEKSGHLGGVLWLTGLSGAGKSTLSLTLEESLFEAGWRTIVLDGDQVRTGLSSDLGFAPEDRSENVRRVAETAKLLSDQGLIAIVALISPTIEQRALARETVGAAFREVYVKADLATCAARDPKGLYARAKARKLTGLTGVDSVYEPPPSPDLELDTIALEPDAAASLLQEYVRAAFGVDACSGTASGQNTPSRLRSN